MPTTDRTIGKEKKLVAQFAGLRGTRESLDRAKRCVLRSTSGKPSCTCFFFSLTLSPSFFLFFRDGLSLVWLVPFAFFSRSSRKQIAAVSFSHLAASIPYFVFFAPVDRLTICIMLEVTSRFENFLHGNEHSPLVLPIEFSSLVDNRVYANPDTLPLFFTSRSCRPFYSPPPPHHVNYNEEGI